MPKMVKVEVIAEQLSYSFDNGDGTHTRREYVRGDVMEMDEASALSSAEGVPPGEMTVQANSAGSLLFTMPPKPLGAARAAVKILSGDASVSKPLKEERVVPAPEPDAKPKGRN
jgi:hypothetical protein